MRHRMAVLATLATAVASIVTLGYSGVAAAASRSTTVSHSDGTLVVAPPATATTARTDDPPIGVSLQTLASSGPAIVIDGTGLPDVSDRGGIHVVVLSATTRQVLQYGTTPRSGGGLELLTEIAQRWASQDAIMIISASQGINAVDMRAFETFTKRLGATELTPAEQARLAAGSSFSIIGNIGGLAGTAWTKVAPNPDPSGGGNITGWLQFNHVTGEYGYVSGQSLTFNTSAPGAPDRGNTIEVDGHSYTRQLPGGRSNGFEILSLDSQTLREKSLTAVQTENTEGAQQLADDLAAASTPDRPGNPAPLVFVQSIGRPVGGVGAWTTAATTIRKLGGSPIGFLNLLGKSDYTLVGSTQAGAAATEAGHIFGDDGPETGVLAPGHNLGFLPVVAGHVGGVNLQLVNLEYQSPEQFPAINAAAENSIGQQVLLCGLSSTSCNFRTKFGSDYQASWSQISTDINTDAVKAPHTGAGFTDAEYQATRVELAKEISKFLQVKNYFTVLRDAFGTSSQDRRVDVSEIGNQVYEAAKPPAADQTTVFAIGLIGKALQVGAFAGPPISAVTGGLSATFGLAAYLGGKETPTTLADQVKVRSDQLAKVSQNQITDAIDSLTGQARIVVTDWGKLQAASRHISDGDWRLPPDPKDYVPTLQQSVKQWFAESLVSKTYPWLIRGTPPPVGPPTVPGLSCDIYSGNWPFPDKREGNDHPWIREPANAWMRAVEAWNPNGAAITPFYFFSREPVIRIVNDDAARNTIPQGLSDMMFGTARGQLGINLFQFFGPRWFGPQHNANDGARRCDL